MIENSIVLQKNEIYEKNNFFVKKRRKNFIFEE
jgi:hypothetical protein